MNEAYQAFPEEDDHETKLSGSEDNDNDDVSSDESISEESTNDSAYQTISKDSAESVPIDRHKRRSTKKLR